VIDEFVAAVGRFGRQRACNSPEVARIGGKFEPPRIIPWSIGS